MKSQQQHIKTAVVILNWNGRELLEQFLPSVVEHSEGEDSRVIVVDNGSIDDSTQFVTENYPNIQLIELDENLGYAEGYNIALQQIDAEYLVLLNSDVETSPNWLQRLVTYMDSHPEVAAVQPKILSYNERDKFEYAGAAGGFIDRFGYPFCRGRILERVEEDMGQYDDEIPIFWATGASLLIRMKDFFEVGQLDSRFFAHMEEIDLCWRLNARGRKVVCIPSSKVYHVGGASLSKSNSLKTYLNFRNNLLMLYKNVPSSIYLTTFFVRFLFDLIAFSHLLFKREFENASSVVKAYRDFYQIRSSFRSDREYNLSKIEVKRIPTQYRGSVLLGYYICGRKTYSAIFRKSQI